VQRWSVNDEHGKRNELYIHPIITLLLMDATQRNATQRTPDGSVILIILMLLLMSACSSSKANMASNCCVRTC
jgi:hypothetical protein